MNIFKITLLIFLFFFCQKVMCQDKIQKLPINRTGFRYQYQDYRYKEKQLVNLFKAEGNNEASSLIRRAIVNKRKALAYSVLSIIGGIGILRLSEDSSESPYSIIPLVTMFSSGIFAIAEYRLFIIKKNRAILVFNSNSESSPKIGTIPIEINLGFTTAGLGIRFSF